MPMTLTPSAGGVAPGIARPPIHQPPVVPPAVKSSWPFQAPATLRLFSIDEYHKLAQNGILSANDRVELLHGYLVNRMSINPPHALVTTKLFKWFNRRLPDGWTVRSQQPVTLDLSEPEPDVTISRGDDDMYATRHPGPTEVRVVVEVADSSLDIDRLDKLPMYATAGIPVYWIVNLVDQVVEVYSDPTPDGEYMTKRKFGSGDLVPIELDGKQVGSIPVAEVI